jgi:tetratricopeptide (TPR) repeat protein
MADGRFAEAADAYARVQPEGGTNLFARARFQRADALARAKRSDEAGAIFVELMDTSSDADLAFAAGLRKAALESAACHFENAISIYTKLLKADSALTDSQRVDVLYRRGKAFYGAYRFAEAEADFAAVAKLQPARAAEMDYLSALCLYGAGRDEDAATAVRKLLASGEVSGSLRAEVEFWLAKYEFGHRNYATALAGFVSCATNASLSAGRRIESLGRAARCCAAQSDYAGVVEFATRATTNSVAVRAISGKTPETAAVAEVFVLQGEALMEMARFNEAVLVLSRAQHLETTPELVRRAAVLKADCLFAMGADDDRRYLQALDAYRAVLRDESLPPSQRLAVAFKVGRALEKLRRFEEAADQYYSQVVMAYYDGVNANTWFDGDARAFFTRAVFILADYYEARGEVRPAIRVLEYLTGVPAAREARKRIQRLEAKKKGGVW